MTLTLVLPDAHFENFFFRKKILDRKAKGRMAGQEKGKGKFSASEVAMADVD